MRARARRARGIALADFIAGTLILAGVLTTWAALTRIQLGAVGAADRRARATYAAEEALAQFRASKGALARAAAAAANGDGFRELQSFAVKDLVPPAPGDPAGRLEARPLAANAEGLRPLRGFEVRATVRWRGEGGGGVEHVSLSTIVAEARDAK